MLRPFILLLFVGQVCFSQEQYDKTSSKFGDSTNCFISLNDLLLLKYCGDHEIAGNFLASKGLERVSPWSFNGNPPTLFPFVYYIDNKHKYWLDIELFDYKKSAFSVKFYTTNIYCYKWLLAQLKEGNYSPEQKTFIDNENFLITSFVNTSPSVSVYVGVNKEGMGYGTPVYKITIPLLIPRETFDFINEIK